MFPSQDAILSTFASQHPLHQRKVQPKRPEAPAPANREVFPAWSVADDARRKANDFASEASREFGVASQMAQARTGQIEPWTPKYYAACTVGGILACVSLAGPSPTD